MVSVVACRSWKNGPGLFNRVIAAITKGVAAQNSPQSHKRTPNDTMGFDSINGILRAGGRKTAGRRKQGGNQELICPDQGKKKMSAAFLQKIFHKFTSSCISFFPVTLFLLLITCWTATVISTEKRAFFGRADC